MLRLPEPMLAKPGPIPVSDGWLFEPKLDGFRCLVCTHGGRYRARSRRGWDMTPRLPELAHLLAPDVQLDGEIVAWDENGQTDWHRLRRRVLHGDTSIPVTLMVFDVLAVEGMPTIAQPYAERRTLLEELQVDGPGVQTVATFEDGEALFEVVCDRDLEGVVAKRLRDPYVPGARLWTKTKNRNTERFAEESTRSTRNRALR